MQCTYPTRGWGGYMIDIVSMGGYTLYRVNEYTKCINTKNELEINDLFKRYSDIITGK
jgi:hypothetical protein